jgi:hypothetical protein
VTENLNGIRMHKRGERKERSARKHHLQLYFESQPAGTALLNFSGKKRKTPRVQPFLSEKRKENIRQDKYRKVQPQREKRKRKEHR